MSTLDWSQLARAVTTRLEWERLCGRGKLLSENSLKQALAEYLQAATTLVIVPEYNHPDLKGARRIDIAGYGPQQKKIDIACEAKWVKDTQGTRDIHGEVSDDIFRLECLRTDMAQQNDRLLIVGGYVEPMDREFYGKRKRVSQGVLTPWVDALLPRSITVDFQKVEIEMAAPTFQSFFKTRAGETLAGQLPKSLHAKMVASHIADTTNDQSIRCDLWLIRSVPKRTLYTP